MATRSKTPLCRVLGTAVVATLSAVGPLHAQGLELGPRQVVPAGNADLVVEGYSVPSVVDWNNDGKKDLLVGQGGTGATTGDGKVRVYINIGTDPSPAFDVFGSATSFYVQDQALHGGLGGDLSVGYVSCMGSFPRACDWNDDGKKDLLIGTSAGNVRFYENVNTDEEPIFDGWRSLQAGGTDIAVGARATLEVVNWDGAGPEDLIMGDGNGNVRYFHNAGTAHTPDLKASRYVQAGPPGNKSDLDVGTRASADAHDLDGDGDLDLVIGDGYGKIRQYLSTGLAGDGTPVFDAWTFVRGDGSDIDIDYRSRPFVCDWSGDGRLDLLVGDRSGRVYLYEGVPEPQSGVLLAGLGAVLRRRKLRRYAEGAKQWLIQPVGTYRG